MLKKIFSPNNEFSVTIGECMQLTDIAREVSRDIPYPCKPDYACFSSDSRFLAMKNKMGDLTLYDIKHKEIVYEENLSIRTGHAMWFEGSSNDPDLLFCETQTLCIELESGGHVSYNWKYGVRDGTRDSMLKRELMQETVEYITKLGESLPEKKVHIAPKLTLETPKTVMQTKGLHLGCISPDGRQLVVLGKHVCIYDIETKQKVGAPLDVLTSLTELAFSNDGKLIAMKNSMGYVAILDVETREFLCRSELTGVEGYGVYFSPDDKYIVTCDWHSNIICLEIKSGAITVINVKNIARDTMNLRIEGVERIGNDFMFYCNGHFDAFAHICIKYPFGEHEPELIIGASPKFEDENGQYYTCKCKSYCRERKQGAWVCDVTSKLIICDEHRKIIATPLEEYENMSCYNGNGWSPDGGYYVANIETQDENGKLQYVNVYETKNWTLIKRYETGRYLCFAEFSTDGKYLIIGTWEKGFVIDTADFY